MRYCPKCHSQVEDRDKYCPYCGYWMKGENEKQKRRRDSKPLSAVEQSQKVYEEEKGHHRRYFLPLLVVGCFILLSLGVLIGMASVRYFGKKSTSEISMETETKSLSENEEVSSAEEEPETGIQEESKTQIIRRTEAESRTELQTESEPEPQKVTPTVENSSAEQKQEKFTETTVTADEIKDVASYILPDSSSRVLQRSELKLLSKDGLRLARNEIYARHGRIFTDKTVRDYFSKQEWYQGTIRPESFSDDLLSKVERYNVKLIQSEEALR